MNTITPNSINASQEDFSFRDNAFADLDPVPPIGQQPQGMQQPVPIQQQVPQYQQQAPQQFAPQQQVQQPMQQQQVVPQQAQPKPYADMYLPTPPVDINQLLGQPQQQPLQNQPPQAQAVPQPPQQPQPYVQEADRIEGLSRVTPANAQQPPVAQANPNTEALLKAFLVSQAQSQNQQSNAQQPQVIQNFQQPAPEQNNLSLIERVLGKEKAADFVYDAEEAMLDDNSDSALVSRAKQAMVFNAVLDSREKENKATSQEGEFNAERDAFMTKMGWNKQQFDAFQEHAKKSNPGLEDIFWMLNKEKFAENASRSTVKQFTDQRAMMSQVSPSLGGNGEVGLQVLSDNAAFNQMFGIDDRIFKSSV